MSDIELLKLAAKAAGKRIEVAKSTAWLIDASGETVGIWRPHADAAQALELAVVTGQRLTLPKYAGFGVCAEPQRGSTAGITVYRPELGDVKQACLAIVMCAAKMAKDMP